MNTNREPELKILTPTGAVKAGWNGVIVVVAMSIGIAASIGYTVRVHTEDDRTWCQLLPILDEPVPIPSSTPAPLSAREKRIADAVHAITIRKCGVGR